MPWEVWALTKKGNRIFIAEYADQNLARWWALNWLRSGALPIQIADPKAEAFCQGNDLVAIFTHEKGHEPQLTELT